MMAGHVSAADGGGPLYAHCRACGPLATHHTVRAYTHACMLPPPHTHTPRPRGPCAWPHTCDAAAACAWPHLAAQVFIAQREQRVVGLDVAVQHARRMHGRQPTRALARHVQRERVPQRPVFLARRHRLRRMRHSPACMHIRRDGAGFRKRHWRARACMHACAHAMRSKAGEK